MGGGFSLIFSTALRSQLAVRLMALSEFCLAIGEEHSFQGFVAFSAAVFLLQVYEAFEVSLISLAVPRGMRGSLKERQRIEDLMTYRSSAQPLAHW